jgi:amidase
VRKVPWIAGRAVDVIVGLAVGQCARVERLDRKLNAVVVRDFERARLEARGLDDTTNTGPLHGVPMTIKEGTDVAGQRKELM